MLIYSIYFVSLLLVQKCVLMVELQMTMTLSQYSTLLHLQYDFLNSNSLLFLLKIYRGTKYQIIGQKLYRESFCLFPSRCSGIEHFILKVIKDLPDMELIINNRDWPQVSRHFGKVLPILSFSKVTTADTFSF